MKREDIESAHEDYLNSLDIEIRKDAPSRWDSDKVLQWPVRIWELREWYNGKLSRQPSPVTLGLHTHNPCNERCPRCSAFRQRIGPNASLPYHLAVIIMTEFSHMGGKSVIFSGGGEPFLHPRASAMVEYAKLMGLEVGVITNGTALSGHDCEVLGQECSWIRFSFDAASPKVRKVSHGVDTWNTLIENCRLVMKNRHIGLVTGAGFLVSNDTIEDAEKAVDVCENLGFQYIQFRPYQYTDDEWFLPEHEERIKKIVEDSKDRNIGVVASGWRKQEETFFRTYDYCWFPHCRCEVAADGSVFPCCHLMVDKKYAWGKVEKEGDFTRIMQSKNMKHVDTRKCLPWCIGHRTATEVQRFMKKIPHNSFL